MDKQQRKRLKNKYKEKSRRESLSKFLNPDDPKYVPYAEIIAPYVNIELGNKLPPITADELKDAKDENELTNRIYWKILEKVRDEGKLTKDIFTVNIHQIIVTFSKYLQAVYFTCKFESAIGIGNSDQEFEERNNDARVELDKRYKKLIESYQLIESMTMIELIEKVKDAEPGELEKIAELYNAKEVEKLRLNFIKKNWKEFVFE